MSLTICSINCVSYLREQNTSTFLPVSRYNSIIDSNLLVGNDLVHRPFVPPVYYLDSLLDVLVEGHAIGADADDLGVLLADIAGQVLHLLGPRGTEEERLAIRSHILEDLADLWLETHIQHAVSLVKHDLCDCSERVSILNEIQQTSRSSNDHIEIAM
jgi:hypothetical protein